MANVAEHFISTFEANGIERIWIGLFAHGSIANALTKGLGSQASFPIDKLSHWLVMAIWR